MSEKAKQGRKNSKSQERSRLSVSWLKSWGGARPATNSNKVASSSCRASWKLARCCFPRVRC